MIRQEDVLCITIYMRKVWKPSVQASKQKKGVTQLQDTLQGTLYSSRKY